ncbi:hypothetical protein NKH47_01880 [Mesorhizobium sp. M1060]|uniref:hypothetical protein n=1 Tax=Mesorhizobium sp. M1060 TaxID=2957052 RepID=UPI00333B280C
MSTRFATIVTDEAGVDIVSTIGQFEGGPPEVRFGHVEQVGPAVMIGMVRGGKKDAVGEWGFPEGSIGAEGRADEIAKNDAKSVRTARAAKAGKGKAAAPKEPAPPAEPNSADPE